MSRSLDPVSSLVSGLLSAKQPTSLRNVRPSASSRIPETAVDSNPSGLPLTSRNPGMPHQFAPDSKRKSFEMEPVTC